MENRKQLFDLCPNVLAADWPAGVPCGLSSSFNYEETCQSLEAKKKRNKSVESPSFFEFRPFIRSFGSSEEEEKVKKQARRSSSKTRKHSISSSTDSLNSEITELSSSQFEAERDMSHKSCCLCALL